MTLKRPLYFVFLTLLAACGLVSPPPTVTPTLPGPVVSTSLPPNPEGTAGAFLKAWQERDYVGMYSLLTPLSQAAISQEAFVTR